MSRRVSTDVAAVALRDPSRSEFRSACFHRCSGVAAVAGFLRHGELFDAFTWPARRVSAGIEMVHLPTSAEAFMQQFMQHRCCMALRLDVGLRTREGAHP